ncbi:MAG: glutamate-1-semialdehyde 2,1-aminomutase [candidate division NC10 bacterium]|nr:glutamate-1-semialdehyde 2,1-aminomutase [candidate division NC10 bacterium]
MRNRSQQLFEEAKRYLPGGVDSPVRSFSAVGGTPLFIERGKGCRIYDVDGREYIDYVCSWGPLIVGHAHPAVVSALQAAVEKGTSYGAPTEKETILARLITEAMPSLDLVRFVNSGTEAAMVALRMARGFTGRDKIVKFEGCYHGHADSLLVKAGSGALTFGIPDSLGVPGALARNTYLLPYNDIDRAAELLRSKGKEIAAVVVEPVAANMGVVPPRPGFLEGLRELTDQQGVLLIFDEVITGFRIGYGGAQEFYGIRPDLTCLGKIIGGGLPVGAFGGRREIMEQVAPLGGIYQAGTLSGNPLTMTAGIETLKLLRAPDFYQRLQGRGRQLAQGLEGEAARAGLKAQVNQVGSMLTAFFTETPVVDYATAKTSAVARYAGFFTKMLDAGIHLAPSQFEAAFLSSEHGEGEIEETLAAARDSFQALKRGDIS